ncbi:class F sortase [Bacillus sp. AK031]
MDSWLKKGMLIYWILLIATIGSNTAASTHENEVSLTAISPVNTSQTVLEPSPELELNYQPDTSFSKNVEVTPKKITIPAIEMTAQVMKVGVKENGEMEVPENINEVGWYEPGAKPGGSGNAVLAGHLDGKGMPGAFYRLSDLKRGDSVVIEGEKGEKLTFQVLGVQSYFTNDAPLESIFGYQADSRLNLITCSGNFDEGAHEYEERLVVYTQLVKTE